MADNGSGPSAILGVVIGALVVLGILVFAFGWYPGGDRTADVNVNAPKVEAPSAPKVDAPDAPKAPNK